MPFAHGPLHRTGWDWWNRTVKDHLHLAIYHEVYAVDSKSWEAIYTDCEPTGLGATSYLKKGDQLVNGVVAEEWISPLGGCQEREAEDDDGEDGQRDRRGKREVWAGSVREVMWRHIDGHRRGVDNSTVPYVYIYMRYRVFVRDHDERPHINACIDHASCSWQLEALNHLDVSFNFPVRHGLVP
jgi:hypothetical protein